MIEKKKTDQRETSDLITYKLDLYGNNQFNKLKALLKALLLAGGRLTALRYH